MLPRVDASEGVKPLPYSLDALHCIEASIECWDDGSVPQALCLRLGFSLRDGPRHSVQLCWRNKYNKFAEVAKGYEGQCSQPSRSATVAV